MLPSHVRQGQLLHPARQVRVSPPLGVVIWERKISVLSVLDTALPSCWVPAQLGTLSTFLCQSEQWASGATLTESWRRILSIWSLQIHGPRFLSLWSQGRCKQAAYPTLAWEGAEVPLPAFSAMRETRLSFCGSPTPTAVREGIHQIKSKYSNSCMHSFDRYFMNTPLNGTYFARCQAYSYEQGSCSYGA